MSNPDEGATSTPASARLRSKLRKSGGEAVASDAVLSYGLTWSLYGYVLGHIVGWITAIAVAVGARTLAQHLRIPFLSTFPGFVAMWLTVELFLGWSLAIALRRYAAKLQLRRIAPSDDFALPPIGWMSLRRDEISVWIERRYAFVRLRPLPACRIPSEGWSIEVSPGGELSGRRTVILCDPLGRRVPIVCDAISDTRRAQSLLQVRRVNGD